MAPGRGTFRASAGTAMDAGPTREEIDHAHVPPRRACRRPIGPRGARQSHGARERRPPAQRGERERRPVQRHGRQRDWLERPGPQRAQRHRDRDHRLRAGRARWRDCRGRRAPGRRPASPRATTRLVALALLLAGPPAAAAPTAVRGVAVDGTRFVVTLTDGTVLPQERLPGTVLAIGDGSGAQRRVRIDTVETDPRNPAGEVVLYGLSEQAADGGWTNLCEPD